MQVQIQFEYGQEDRMSEVSGPYEYIQATYDCIRASPDGETHLANLIDGLWTTPDKQTWSDFVISAVEH